MKTKFFFGNRKPGSDMYEFIKEYPFHLYPVGTVAVDDCSYEIAAIETCLDDNCIYIYLDN